MDDLYSILNVNPNASAEEIKKSYRKLQMKHHPDRGGAAELSGKINSAYETLSDPEKRRIYDAKRNNPFNAGMRDEIFNMFFGGGNGGGMQMPWGFNMGHGGNNGIHIFKNGVPVNIPQLRKPVPIVKTIQITLKQAYTGINIPLEIERWYQEADMKKVEKEKIYVDIPQGIDDNEIIIVKNKGNVLNENNKGDIKIFVKIENQTKFKRKGLDLIYKKKLTLKEALVGFKFDLKHLSGKTYILNNTDGTTISPNFYKTIQNMGMLRKRQHPASPLVGNLVIVFSIEFPKKLSLDQREKIKEIL